MKINTIKLIGILIITIMILSTSNTIAGIPVLDQNKNIQEEEIIETTNSDTIPYEGMIRVYIVEPTSRYINRGVPYPYGFVDYAIEEPLSLEYEDAYTETVTWDGTSAGFEDITEDNIMVIAVVSNPERHLGYAYPPFKNPFDAFYTDATAAAYPGETGYNQIAENFTHTVFVIEGTATYCGYCPDTRDMLKAIYNSSDYPFYYAALVGDKNQVAYNTLRDYNLYGYPTCFFDGGYRTVVGGYDYESVYRNGIKAAGKRDIHEINLSVSLQWLGEAQLEVTVEITNNEILENTPPEKPNTPEGDIEGGPEILYNYTTSTTDADGNDITYWFDWGDGNNSGWTEYKKSGQTIKLANNWTVQGIYEIKVKAKDSFGYESEWSDPLIIEIPKSINVQEQQQMIPQSNNKGTTNYQEYAEISFQVFEGDGCACKPIPDAEIWAYGLDFGHNDSTFTDNDGTAILNLEYNVHYRVTTQKEGFQTVRFDFLVLDDQEFVIHLEEEESIPILKLPIFQRLHQFIRQYFPSTFLNQRGFTVI